MFSSVAHRVKLTVPLSAFLYAVDRRGSSRTRNLLLDLGRIQSVMTLKTQVSVCSYINMSRINSYSIRALTSLSSAQHLRGFT